MFQVLEYWRSLVFNVCFQISVSVLIYVVDTYDGKIVHKNKLIHLQPKRLFKTFSLLVVKTIAISLDPHDALF